MRPIHFKTYDKSSLWLHALTFTGIRCEMSRNENVHKHCMVRNICRETLHIRVDEYADRTTVGLPSEDAKASPASEIHAIWRLPNENFVTRLEGLERITQLRLWQRREMGDIKTRSSCHSRSSDSTGISLAGGWSSTRTELS